MIPASTPIYVFGCFGGRPGHYLYTTNKRWVHGMALDHVWKACDWHPHSNYLERPRTPFTPVDGVLHSTRPPSGWSIVAWWDHRGDERNGSHTAIAAPGTWTAAELLEAGRARAPWAFRVEVVAP